MEELRFRLFDCLSDHLNVVSPDFESAVLFRCSFVSLLVFDLPSLPHVNLRVIQHLSRDGAEYQGHDNS